MNFIQKSLAAVVVGGGMMVLGCAQNNPGPGNPVVPESATAHATGDKSVSFTAPHDGVVYLRDDNDNRVLYSNDVKKGQVVKYDAKAEQLMIDDSPAPQKIAGNNHEHTILFQPLNEAQPAAANSATPGGNTAENAAQTNPATQSESANSPTTRPSSQVPVIHVPLGVQVDVQTQPSGGK